MAKDKRISLDVAARTCRKYGIKRFKCEDFEFELGVRKNLVQVVSDKIEKLSETLPIKTDDMKSFFSGMPSDEELLFAASEGLPKEKE